MSIRMIVTDLDGTFYHRDFTYDKTTFQSLYQMMKQEKIHFVVASGNQYSQLHSFFDETDHITFVAENGGYVIDQEKELFVAKMNKDTYIKALEVISNIKGVEDMIVCGKKAAYVSNNISDFHYQIFQKYFPNLIKVDDLTSIHDTIIKLSLSVDDHHIRKIKTSIDQELHNQLTAIVSGHGCIDLILPGIHKGNALKQLMDRWNITADEIMAFGDSDNDTEMLELAGYGFVMKNGNPLLQDKIGRVCPYTNEEDGELKIIQEYFDNPKIFLEKYK